MILMLGAMVITIKSGLCSKWMCCGQMCMNRMAKSVTKTNFSFMFHIWLVQC